MNADEDNQSLNFIWPRPMRIIMRNPHWGSPMVIHHHHQDNIFRGVQLGSLLRLWTCIRFRDLHNKGKQVLWVDILWQFKWWRCYPLKLNLQTCYCCIHIHHTVICIYSNNFQLQSMIIIFSMVTNNILMMIIYEDI